MKVTKATVPKIILLTLCFTVCTGIIFTQAKLKLPIHPGDHVIDIKRLNDSILVYGKKVLEAQQQLQRWQQMVLKKTGVTGISDRVNAALDTFEQSVTGTTVINPTRDITDTPMRHINGYDLHTHEFEDAVIKEQQSSVTDVAAVMADGIRQQEQYTKEAEAILSIDPVGSLGEKQQKNALLILNAMNNATMAKMEGAQMVHEIEQQEAQYAQELIDQKRQDIAYWNVADPYHPSAYDEEHAPAIDNFGFLSTISENNH